MLEGLPRLIVSRKTGDEVFHLNGDQLGFDLRTFWQWSVSDLVTNVTRGRLAEFIVARALGLGVDDVRDEWAPYDLLTSSGLKVEVKSAAVVQSWYQKRPSTITFVVPKTRAWDPATNVQDEEARRQADVYIFALLSHADKSTIDPLDLSQWEFYVVPTAALDARERSQHSITLRSLRSLAVGPVTYGGLAGAVAEADAR